MDISSSDTRTHLHLPSLVFYYFEVGWKHIQFISVYTLKNKILAYWLNNNSD